MSKHTLAGLIAAILVVFGFVLGHVTKDTTRTITVEKEKIVNPAFEFKVGDKKYCEIVTEIKPCEIVGQKSSGTYAIKYNEDGWFGGEKIITIPASQILK